MRTAWCPFTAHVKRELGALAKFDDRITEDPLNVKQMRWLQSTPDGSQIVFSALGKIWIASPGATPRRLTSAKDREYAPQISPDGKFLVWVTWNDKYGGHLWKSDLAGSTPVSLSQSPAFYAVPEWSPDSKRIAFIMGSASGWLEEDRSEAYELKLISSAGGTITSVHAPALSQLECDVVRRWKAALLRRSEHAASHARTHGSGAYHLAGFNPRRRRGQDPHQIFGARFGGAFAQ